MKIHKRIIEDENGIWQRTSYEIRNEDSKEKQDCPSYEYNGHITNCQCRQCSKDDFRF